MRKKKGDEKILLNTVPTILLSTIIKSFGDDSSPLLHAAS